MDELNYWDLNNKDDLIEFYKTTLIFMSLAVAWADSRLRYFPARVKSGEDVFSEARELMIADIQSGKIKIQNLLLPTQYTLFNFMKQVIYRYKKEEWPVTREYQFSETISFEKVVDLADLQIQNLTKEENEIYFERLLAAFLKTLSGLEKQIVEVVLSDHNDLYRLLKSITNGLTDNLILELLKCGYIDQNGDTGIKFKKNRPPAALKLSVTFKPYRKMIHKILTANRILLTVDLIALYLRVSVRDVRKNCVKLRRHLKTFKKEFDLKSTKEYRKNFKFILNFDKNLYRFIHERNI